MLGRGQLHSASWHVLCGQSIGVQLGAHVSVGACCLAAALLAMYRAERAPFQEVLTVWRRQRHDTKT